MNTKKLLLSAVVSFAVMFTLGGLWHMMLMEEWYSNHAGGGVEMVNIVKRAEPMIMYIALGTFLMALVMSYLYPKGVESDNKVMEGLKFGAIIGILVFIPLELILYGATHIFSRSAILMDAVWNMFNAGMGGIVIALIYGDDAKKK